MFITYNPRHTIGMDSLQEHIILSVNPSTIILQHMTEFNIYLNIWLSFNDYDGLYQSR